jgi:hypothetical protein
MSSLHSLGIISLLSLTVFAGCAAQSGDTGESDSEAITSTTKTAFNFTATLGNVTADAARGPAVGLWTNVELKYQVSCEEKFETFSYALRKADDGKTELLVSAVGSRTETPGAFHCQSIMLQTKTVTLPGFFSKNDLKLVNLTGKPEAFLETTKSLEPIGLEVSDVRSLCPEGAECALAGTIVKLKTTKPVSCVDKIAPLSYAVEQSSDKKVKLAAAAIDMVDSRLVRCLSIAKEVEITLPGILVSKADIELTSVGGAP